jgi:hypothetical protein
LRQPAILRPPRIQIVTYGAACRNTRGKEDAHTPFTCRGNHPTMKEIHVTPLKTSLGPGCLALELTATSIQSANAGWSRSGGGVARAAIPGAPVDRVPVRSASVTPGRRSRDRVGNTSCSGGTCIHNATLTGPYGNGVPRSGTVRRYWFATRGSAPARVSAPAECIPTPL